MSKPRDPPLPPAYRRAEQQPPKAAPPDARATKNGTLYLDIDADDEDDEEGVPMQAKGKRKGGTLKLPPTEAAPKDARPAVDPLGRKPVTQPVQIVETHAVKENPKPQAAAPAGTLYLNALDDDGEDEPKTTLKLRPVRLPPARKEPGAKSRVATMDEPVHAEEPEATRVVDVDDL